MLIILSPAKLQHIANQQITDKYTIPACMEMADELVHEMKQLSVSDLHKLLSINTSLAQTNADRFFHWNTPFTLQNARQAVFTYNGEVFHGLDAKSLSGNELDYMQSHLRILSGLYGVLRPLDLIQPYRLEISTKLHTAMGETIYDFWGNRITELLQEALKESGKPTVLLNLASHEYFKSIDSKRLNCKVIQVEFLERKMDGEGLKTVVVYVKKARGLMTRYVIQNQLETVEDLKGFHAAGYWFEEKLSTDTKLVFVR